MVSAGAACSSGKVKASRVIEAMGLPDLSPFGIRVSGGWATTAADWAALRRRLARDPRPSPGAPARQGRGLGTRHARRQADHRTRRDAGALQARLRHRRRPGVRAEGALRGDRPLHLGPEGRAGLDAGVAARRVRALAGAGRAGVGAGPLPAHRLPGQLLLRRAQEEGRSEEPGRGRSGAAGDLREARHPAEGAGSAGRRRGRAALRGRRGVRQRLGAHHLQEGAGRGRA